MLIRRLRSLLRYSYAVPWCVPAWGRDELRATLACLAAGRLVRGTHVDELQSALADELGVQHVVAANRGRTAIEAVLRALDVGAGDEVVVPAYVCDTVREGVRRTGATPVPADVGDDLHVTAGTVEAALTSRTRAVVVAHLFGAAAPVDDIERLLDGHPGVALVDDAAQSFGALRAGRPVGSFGACGVIGIGAGKALAGSAGALLATRDAALAERARAWVSDRSAERARDVVRRHLRFWLWRRLRGTTLPVAALAEAAGVPLDREPPHAPRPMANADAAVGLAQLRAARRNAERRRAHLGPAREALAPLVAAGARLLTFGEGAAPLKCVVVLASRGPQAAEVIRALAECGVEAQRGYTTAPDARAPRAETLATRVVCLPLETGMPDRLVRRVASALRALLNPVPQALRAPAVPAHPHA